MGAVAGGAVELGFGGERTVCGAGVGGGGEWGGGCFGFVGGVDSVCHGCMYDLEANN